MILFMASATTVAVKSSGSGGIHEFIDNLNDDEILFGALRVSIGSQVKFYHVFFVGSNVGGMKRGKATLYESAVFQALEGGHGKITFSEGKESCTATAIAAQISTLSRTEFTV